MCVFFFFFFFFFFSSFKKKIETYGPGLPCLCSVEAGGETTESFLIFFSPFKKIFFFFFLFFSFFFCWFFLFLFLFSRTSLCGGAAPNDVRSAANRLSHFQKPFQVHTKEKKEKLFFF